jgi:dolichyl-phosphate beta-glucosyltransferase
LEHSLLGLFVFLAAPHSRKALFMPRRDREAIATSLTVIFPTYKEAVRLPRTLVEFGTFLADHFQDYEILIVDDNSPDGTREAVFANDMGIDPHLQERIRVINQGGRYGKGAAVRRGFEEARCDIVMFMDADHSTRIENVVEAVKPILAGEAGAVVGVRLVTNEEPMRRRVISLGLLGLAHLIAFTKPVMDSQCGFKLFDRSVSRRLANHCRIDRGLIDVEILTLLQMWNISYGYCTVHWQNDPDSRIELGPTIARDLRDLGRIWHRRRTGVYQNPLEPQEKVWFPTLHASQPEPAQQQQAIQTH